MYGEGAEGTGGGLHHLSPVGIGAPAAHQKCTDAEPVAEADDGADVAGVLHLVQGHHQPLEPTDRLRSGDPEEGKAV